ncbi:MAG: UDP-3-O-(3-hydroxymyristoyl)glucosamine N-acyltransferase [Cyclobacteriaceae bacterium]|nr:UDP-3-O-(3-hydroxymyristoyl)glucosamine N-acyltransferase [Cyclobacteriaceae bacterium]
MKFSIGQLATLLGGEVVGNPDEDINMLAAIQDAKKGQVSFLSNPKYEPHIYNTQATAVIVSKDFEPKKKLNTTQIKVDDPYVAFATLLEEYHKYINFSKVGIEEPSYIGENVKVGEGIYRGAFSYIGEESVIGENVKIYPHAYIGNNSIIGDNTIIHSGVKIYPNSKIGSNCVLHSGVVIGSDGFGFAPQEDGTYKNIPQLGNVVICDDVHIGSNTVIDCAAMPSDSTIIGNGTKLDNLIQIAHNVKIGENTVVAGQSAIAGSTEIGDNCVFGGQVGVAGHIKVANKTSLGAQTGLGRSVKNEGEKLFGSPAINLSQFYRSYAVFKNLPDLSTRLKQLEEKILNLPTT